MTTPPYKAYTKTFRTKFGVDVEQTLIGTEYNHPQLKSPAPVVTMSTTVAEDGSILNIVHIGKEDADFIVKSCNTHNQLIDIARRAFVKLPDCKLSKDIESLFIMLNEPITPS